jgi:hypothetical protein
MQIKIYPEELVKCGVWDAFSYYVVNDVKKAQEILEENKEFDLPVRDALVIGLLKVIESPNLIHRFNQALTDYLNIKTQKKGSLLLIRKKGVISLIEKFLNKYPDYWTPDSEYEAGLVELVDYINEYKDELDKLEIHPVTDQFGTHEFLNATHVKKLLSFNYGN